MALQGTPRLTLAVAEHLQALPAGGSGEVAVRDVAYLFGIGDESGRELLSYHWHPSGPSRIIGPHLHVHADIQLGTAWLPKVHVPTGPVALQDVLRVLLEELGVEPIRDDWELVLESTRS